MITLSNVKPAAEGLLEYRIDFAMSHRVYFGRDDETLIILLTGSTKKRRQHELDRIKIGLTMKKLENKFHKN